MMLESFVSVRCFNPLKTTMEGSQCEESLWVTRGICSVTGCSLPCSTQRHPKRNFNARHMSARSTVERSIGVLKKRWHSLRRLRLEPAKACQVISVCVMLHNQAPALKLDVPSDSESDSSCDSSSDSECESDSNNYHPANYQQSELVRASAGKAAR